MSDTQLDQVNQLGRSRSVERGKTIIWAGDPTPGTSIVVSGLLKITASTDDGREQIVGLLFPGDTVGSPYAATADHSVTALAPSRLCSFSRGDFERLLDVHPSLAQRLLRQTLGELRNSRDWMLLLGQRTAQEKVATFLLDLARRAEGSPLDAGGTFELALTRQQMADVLGLTIETVSRQMTKLKACGAVQLPDARSARILRLDLLKQLAGA